MHVYGSFFDREIEHCRMRTGQSALRRLEFKKSRSIRVEAGPQPLRAADLTPEAFGCGVKSNSVKTTLIASD